MDDWIDGLLDCWDGMIMITGDIKLPFHVMFFFTPKYFSHDHINQTLFSNSLKSIDFIVGAIRLSLHYNK